MEFLSQKNDASLFAFGTHSKKRPHNLVFGRLFDHHILDMVETGVAGAWPPPIHPELLPRSAPSPRNPPARPTHPRAPPPPLPPPPASLQADGRVPRVARRLQPRVEAVHRLQRRGVGAGR